MELPTQRLHHIGVFTHRAHVFPPQDLCTGLHVSLPTYTIADGKYIPVLWALLAGPHLDSFSWGGALALSALSPTVLGLLHVESFPWWV